MAPIAGKTRARATAPNRHVLPGDDGTAADARGADDQIRD
jgi:hypothetical protein